MRFIVVIFLVGVQVLSSPLAPYDLLDEAEALLEELRASISAEILAAHENLDDVGAKAVKYGDTIYFFNHFILTSYANTRANSVNAARAEAAKSEEDKSHCFDNEPQLQILLSLATTRLQACIIDIQSQINNTIDTGKYYIDVQYNKVTEIAFNLNKCTSDDVTCISSVVTVIGESNVQLVQNIQDQVQATSGIVGTLQTTFTVCVEDSIQTYSVDSAQIIDDIYSCIEE